MRFRPAITVISAALSLALCSFAMGNTAVKAATMPGEYDPKDPARVNEQTPIMFESGHIDLFNPVPNAKEITLLLKEDVTGSHVLRKPENVAIAVREQAWEPKLAEYQEFGNTAGYYLPIVQNPKLPWPGWDSLDLGSYGKKNSEDSIAEVKIIFEKIEGPGRVSLCGQGTFGGFQPILDSGSCELVNGSVRTQKQLAHEHTNWAFTKPGLYKMTIRVQAKLKNGKELSTQPAIYRWAVGDKEIEKTKADFPLFESPSGTNPAPVDANSSNGDNTECKAEKKITEITKPKDNGQVVTRTGGSVYIGANTHVHPNWVFNKPGQYTLGITQTATLNNGQRISTHSTLRFNVGGSGSANNGHFDLGTKVEGGRLVASLKDDRSSPANWVTPSSLVFGVGETGHTKAPKGIEFIAAPGDDIWMISSTQIQGVPWLGANTMHSSMLENTKGPVVWTLTSAQGPGAVAVFTSGNFGKAVGDFWFGGAKLLSGSTDYGKVYLKDGKYYRIVVEGRTADGKTCTLPNSEIQKYHAQGYDVAGKDAGRKIENAAVVNSGEALNEDTVADLSENVTENGTKKIAAQTAQDSWINYLGMAIASVALIAICGGILYFRKPQ